jgi:hypothetical protein
VLNDVDHIGGGVINNLLPKPALVTGETIAAPSKNTISEHLGLDKPYFSASTDGIGGNSQHLSSSAGNKSAYEGLVKNKESVTLELFGGETGQIPGAINIDIEAVRGIKTDILKDKLSFVPSESVDKIITFNPYIPPEYGGTGLSDYLIDAARVLKPGGTITISGEFNNKFSTFINKRNNIKQEVQSLLDQLGLEVQHLSTPLPSQYHDMKFYKYDQGNFSVEIPHDKIKTTVLTKKI